MKHPTLHKAWMLFKAYFLPQPSHDEQFSLSNNNPATDLPTATADSPPAPAPAAASELESAEAMERRASRENARNINLHEENLSSLAQPPEGSEARASRASNPFSRSTTE